MRAFSRFAAFLEITPLAAALSTAEEAEFSGRGLGGRGGVKLLDRGLGGGLDHLVAEGLVLNNADALDSRFNVRQRNSPPRV